MSKNTPETVRQAALDAVSKAITDDLPERANTFASVYSTLVYADKPVTSYNAQPLLRPISETSKAKTGVQSLEVTPPAAVTTESTPPTV